MPIEQATYNKSLVNWKDCTQPYAVDLCAFRNHKRGRSKGCPRHPDPKVCTNSEKMAITRRKTKVINTIKSVGTYEQQRLILLKVLTDPSFRDFSSSIGINMKEIQAGQQVLRCSRKLIVRSKNGRRRTSVVKRTVVQAKCVGLLPTPTKEPSTDNEESPPTQRELSMREISRRLGFTYGTGHRSLSLAQTKRADIAEGKKEGWIMLSEDKQRSKYTPELLTTLEYWIENNEMVRHSPFKDSLIVKRD
jgi:hypothetical protein